MCHDEYSGQHTRINHKCNSKCFNNDYYMVLASFYK